jgi:hypothetical protein
MTGATNFFLTIVILPALLPSGFAQQAPNSPSGTRSIVVNVLDAHGNALRDLTKDNFRLHVNRKPTVVHDARYSLAPRRIVVLLDMSGSMTGDKATGKWRIAREAAEDLLAEIPVDVPIALLTFSGEVRDVLDFSQGRAAIAKWLKEDPGQRPNHKYSKPTALFDAILVGLKLLQPVQPGDAVYAITDGGDNASRASASKTKSSLLHSGVRLFAFLFAEPLPDPFEEGKASFLSMVNESGGFVFAVSGRAQGGGDPLESRIYDADHPEKLWSLTHLLNLQVNGFWTLEVAVPSSNKASSMKLEVAGDGGEIRKDVWVAYCKVLPAAR